MSPKHWYRSGRHLGNTSQCQGGGRRPLLSQGQIEFFFIIVSHPLYSSLAPPLDRALQQATPSCPVSFIIVSHPLYSSLAWPLGLLPSEFSTPCHLWQGSSSCTSPASNPRGQPTSALVFNLSAATSCSITFALMSTSLLDPQLCSSKRIGWCINNC